MQRWKISVLLGIFIGVVIISCMVLLINTERGEETDRKTDLPLHPRWDASHSKQSSLVRKSSNQSQPQSHQKPDYHTHDNGSNEHDHHDDDDVQDTYRHNYRRRFSDAIKGVFKVLISSKNTSTSDYPKESSENSSRLKRQLDFGSASDETPDERTTKPTPPSVSRRPTIKFTTRRPVIKVFPVGEAKRSSELLSLASKEDSNENKINNSGSKENSNAVRKASRYSKPLIHFRSLSSPSKERYDVSSSENNRNPKNFTYEVVNVVRKVVRKEDGHVPAYFTKGNFNIEPRLAKVDRKEALNRPAVLYRKTWSPEQGPRPKQPLGRFGAIQPAKELSAESSSSSEDVKRKGEDSKERKVVVNLQQLPYNDGELSEEDIQDFQEGHSTFGSKENVSLRKRSGGPNDRKFVIEKGVVTERTLERDNLFDSPEVDIYSVPGGRTSTTENTNPKQGVSQNENGVNGGRGNERDLTSPEVPSSFEDLYRRGHPGVVPPPNNSPLAHRNNPSLETYDDAEEYEHGYPYNPLIDDPPLKFDPASDRFYGSPVSGNKKRLATSQSPAKDENEPEPSQERNVEYQDYFRPRGRSASYEIENEDDTTTPSSAESPPANNNSPDEKLYYGRPYIPPTPDYSTDYDTGIGGDRERGNSDPDVYDFVGLDENFDKQNSPYGPPEDFFDFPGARGQGSFRPRAVVGRSGEVDSNEHGYFDKTTPNRKGPRKPPVAAQPPRDNNPDYDGNTSSQENDYGGFGSSSGSNGNRRNAETLNDGKDESHIYDSGFIQTLKEFDEEIKKLQEEERKKLLHSIPLRSPDQQRVQQNPGSGVGTTSGYKEQGPPLIITSPGPIENSQESSSPPSSQEVSSTVGVTDDESPTPSTVPFNSSENSEEGGTADGGNGDEEEEDEEPEDNNRSTGGVENSTGKSEEEDEDNTDGKN